MAYTTMLVLDTESKGVDELLKQLDKLDKQLSKSIDSLQKLAGESEEAGEEAKKAGKKFKKSGKDAEGLGKSAKATGKKLAGNLATGIAVATAAIAAYAIQAVASISETKKMADAAQMGYDEFQNLANAAETVGIEAEQTSDIMRDLGIRMGEALVHQSGEAYEVLNKLGISLEDVANKTPEEQLQIVAERMDEMGISSGDARTMLDQLGSDLDKMYPLLKNGAAGLKEMTAQFDELNVKMTDIEADKLSDLTDEFGRAKDNLDDFVGSIVAGMAPALTDLLVDFQKGMKYASDLNREFLIAERAGVLLSGAFEYISNSLKTTYSGFLTIVNVVGAVHNKMISLALYAGSAFAGAFEKPTAVIIEMWNKLIADLTGMLSEFLGKMDGWMGDMAPEWVGTANQALKQMSADSQKAADAAAETAKTASESMANAGESYATKSEQSLDKAEGHFKDFAVGVSKAGQIVLDTHTKLINVTPDVATETEKLKAIIQPSGGANEKSFLDPTIQGVTELDKLLAGSDISAQIKLLEQQLSADKSGVSDNGKLKALEAEFEMQKQILLLNATMSGGGGGEDPAVVAKQSAIEHIRTLNAVEQQMLVDNYNIMNETKISFYDLEKQMVDDLTQYKADARQQDLADLNSYGAQYSSVMTTMEGINKGFEEGGAGAWGAVSDAAGMAMGMMEQDSVAYKAMAITQATIAASMAVLQAMSAPPPMNLILPPIIGAMAGAQVATILAAKDGASMVGVPHYAGGTSNVTGKGTSKSDDVPAMLSRGESVLTASASESMGRANIDAMNKGMMPNMGGGGGGNVAVDAPLIIQGNVDNNTMNQLSMAQQKQVEQISSQVTRTVTRMENKSGGIFKKYGKK